MKDIVLCPGSRSGPLALAAGALRRKGSISLKTSIDERSAAFCALGKSTASGLATAVITTSGTAVANLLPAAIEADLSCQPLLLLTADRPFRLKNCGSNQTVNQEDFLQSVCRAFFNTPKQGIHFLSESALHELVDQAWRKAHQHAGPVHINLPFEEPLHPSQEEQSKILIRWLSSASNEKALPLNEQETSFEVLDKSPPMLDPAMPGVIIVGPWRGLTPRIGEFQDALSFWQNLSGWPVFADPLSGVPFDFPGLIHSWDLLIPSQLRLPEEGLQLLRLGPMPASRNLESWIRKIRGNQVLITEGENRKLDPLGLSMQWDGGLVNWIAKINHSKKVFTSKTAEKPFLDEWLKVDMHVQRLLDDELPLKGTITEPSLARWLPRLIPKDIPVMLAASSPIRDWIKFLGDGALDRHCFGFRGASGIDGTLSLAVGLSFDRPLVLVTGDLALIHDTNGWLLANQKTSPLVVLLIDNGGGGIFQQIELSTDPIDEFETLFAMPQKVDPLMIADAHSIPSREVLSLEDLDYSLNWGFRQLGPVLLRVCTNRKMDSELRKSISKKLSKPLPPNSPPF